MSNHSPKPLILTAALDGPDGPYAGMISDHVERHMAYCRRHGYKFYGFTTAEAAGLDHPSPYWFKVDLILRYLQDPRFSHVIWMDTDAIIVKDDIDLRDALTEDAWLGLTIHPYSDGVDVWHPQSGVMYIRSCEKSIEFFKKVWGMTSVASCEQTAMHQILMTCPGYQKGVVILPFRWNNTLHDQPHDPIVAAFHGNGDPETRREIMRKYVANGCKEPIGRTAKIDIDAARGVYERALMDGDPDKAIAVLKRVVRDWPNEVNALRSLGSAYQEKGDGPGMISAYGQALALDPRDVQLHILIAQAYDGVGNDQLAAFHYNTALDIDPDCARAHLHRGYFLMTRGWNYPSALCSTDNDFLLREKEAAKRNWEDGVADYEWSKCVAVTGMMRPNRTRSKEWWGLPIPGRSIYVYHEQGLGDSLWMVRWLRELKQQSEATIILEAPPALIGLYSNNRQIGADMVVSMQPVEGFAVKADYSVSIMSLFQALGVGPHTEQPTPYLTIDGPEYFPEGKVIGLCWKGSSGHPNDAQRSIPFKFFEPLRERYPHIQFVSLQHEDDTIPPMLEGDMMATAARIAACDCVITVDSSVAHLAGAMGKPTFTLLPMNNDWRWFKGTDKTPWYPSMTLVRQRTQGDWGDVISRLTDLLDGRTDLQV